MTVFLIASPQNFDFRRFNDTIPAQTKGIEL
jgi:hypothetical protein